jgi:hypothetical protein
MVKTRVSKKFDKCVKSVRKTVRARKGSNKESAAIAICTKSVLQTRGRTMKRYRKGHLQTQKKRRGGAIFSDETKDRLRGMRDKVITSAKNAAQQVMSRPDDFRGDVIIFVQQTARKEVGITTERGEAAIKKIKEFMQSPSYNPQKVVQRNFSIESGFSPEAWERTVNEFGGEILRKSDKSVLTDSEKESAKVALENLTRSKGKVDMPMEDILLLNLLVENWTARYVPADASTSPHDAYVAATMFSMLA